MYGMYHVYSMGIFTLFYMCVLGDLTRFKRVLLCRQLSLAFGSALFVICSASPSARLRGECG